MKEEPLIRLREVRKHYALNGGIFSQKRVVKAVDGVSFDIQRAKPSAGGGVRLR
ncbi:dipeptide transporter ATP-binding subunit [Kluyvera cryocrescens]|uniref:Dipeptide transporter ATP-binding subunit n=1 Tax=Kluyvera cryocrescens TaxID=580 RepID=A0A485D0T4_KLUCR|nr:dipeptide transporter ATP-binding subunit [Kluyvera cryocrescens]